jgi:argininosuccinate lyase
MSGGSGQKSKTGEKSRKPWGGRFSEATNPAVERFSASIHFDQALARHDIRGSKAQARMLGSTGLISNEDALALVGGLDRIAKEIEDGTFPFDPAFEDIHMNIESRLREHLGPVAGKLHTGRSRNDQVATDLALFLREVGLESERALLGIRGVLLERSREHVDTILPGYTHLQRAQPVRLAHQWLAHIETLGRDASRFRDGRARITRSPLGAGALAGSTLPLDREQTAAELGFSGPTRNSMDTVASRDAALEYLANAAISMVHLSRLAEELVLWSSSEFGFIELADAYSTGSSLMPQKKNPDVPELVRGKSGRAIGNLVTLLTVLKGLPLTYNRDLQEDKEPLFDSARTLLDSLEVMSGAIATLVVRTERMADAAADPMLLATDLAEILVVAGVPFRDAHEVVGGIVGHCTRKNVSLRSLTHAEMQSFHPAFEAGADQLLALERSLESRQLAGGTSRSRVEAMLDEIETELAAERGAIEAAAATEAEGS